MTRPSPDGPILITGLDHSEKTRLRLLLAASPSVWLTRRSELWTAPHPSHAPLDAPAGLRACLTSLLERPAVAAMVDDAESLIAAFGAGPRTHPRLFSLIHERNANRHGRRRWGDQDSQLELVAPRLLADLPDARVLHVVVDPRRRFAALQRSAARRVGLVGSATAAWVASVRRGTAMARAEPDRYRLLRSESIDDPGELAEILRWLAIEDPAGPLAPERGERADVGISPADRSFIECAAAPELAALGYDRPSSATRRGRRAGVDAILRDPLAWGRYALRMRREPRAASPARRGAR